MPSPFPGMDPYLEDPELWSGFHASFIAELQTQLSPLIRPDYFVRIEERVYLAEQDDPAYRLIVPDARIVEARTDQKKRNGPIGGLMIAEPIPVLEPADDEIHETRLEIRDRNDRSVVTVIELLSPTNKVAGSKGRDSFLQKRKEILASTAHWIEIDLLRTGVRSRHTPEARTPYLTYLSLAENVRKGFVWPIPLRKSLPVIGVPLRVFDTQVPLDLQQTLTQVYERGGYDLDLDYAIDPAVALSPDDGVWAKKIISSKHSQ